MIALTQQVLGEKSQDSLTGDYFTNNVQYRLLLLFLFIILNFYHPIVWFWVYSTKFQFVFWIIQLIARKEIYRTDESSCWINKTPACKAAPLGPLLASRPFSNPAFISSWRAQTSSRRLILLDGWWRKLSASRRDEAWTTPNDRRHSTVAS